MGGKLGSRADINAVTPGSLLHIEDQLTHRRFLCDTGASYSILPHHSSAVASGPSLHGPAGRQIKCWGERELTLTFNDKQYKWIFLLADVKFAIIGIDFLKHFKLVVDAAAGQLIDTKTMAIITAVPGAVQRTSGGLFCAVGTAPPAYRSILVEYQDVLNSTGDLPPPAHKVEHHLITAGRPVTPGSGGWTQRSMKQLAPLSRSWSGKASFAAPTAVGPLHCTWSRRPTAAGGHVATSDSSTSSLSQTSILYRGWMTWLAGLRGSPSALGNNAEINAKIKMMDK